MKKHKKAETDIDTENKQVVTRGGKGWGRQEGDETDGHFEMYRNMKSLCV